MEILRCKSASSSLEGRCYMLEIEVQNSAMGHSQSTTMHLKGHSLIDTSDEDY